MKKGTEIPCPAKLKYTRLPEANREIFLSCEPCGLRRVIRFSVETDNPQRRADPPLPDNLTTVVDNEIARCPIRRAVQNKPSPGA